MAVTSTSRLAITQWSAGTDPFNRAQLNQSFANLEARASGFLQGTVRPAAGPEYQGYFFFNTTGNALSYCDGSAWWDLVAGDGNFGSPVALAIGASGSDGVQSTAARSDHVHEMPSFGTPVSIGTANATGTGSAVARATHVHVIGNGAINDSNMFAPGILGSASIENLSITTGKLADLSVTTGKIAAGAVINSKLGTDIDASKITAGTLGVDRIPSLDVAKITTGTFAASFIPSLDASKITTGTFADARIPSLSGSKITSGTIAYARLPVGTSANTVSEGDHNHDSRYYTESQVNSLLAGKSSTSHNHSGVYLSDNGGTISGSLTITGSLGVGSDMSNTGAPGTTNSGLASWRVGTNKAFWAFTSSRRYKEDIQDADEEIVEKMLQLRPVTFKSKIDDTDERFVGLIAEEVREIMPSITQGYNPETGDVDTVGLEGLIVPLLLAVKNLKSEVSDLRAQLDN